MDREALLSEIRLKAVRSSGAGGQNVNKVSTKVALSFDVHKSVGLTDDEKALVLDRLSTKLTSAGILNLSADDDRSQLRNKEIVMRRFIDMIEKALVVQKHRKATKIPKGVKEKRLSEKRSKSDIKETRRKPRLGL
jgi:ribosome-associated protein